MSVPHRAEHRRKTVGLTLVMLGAWALFAAIVLLVEDSLNAVSVPGLLLVPIALLLWFAHRQDAIDEEHGPADD